jgi:hypothetical protein
MYRWRDRRIDELFREELGNQRLKKEYKKTLAACGLEKHV